MFMFYNEKILNVIHFFRIGLIESIFFWCFKTVVAMYRVR